jgi:hypothetical protein
LTVLLGGLLAAGALGLTSPFEELACFSFEERGPRVSSGFSLLPPGYSCETTTPQGVTFKVTEWGKFAIVATAMLVVIAAALVSRPRLPLALRTAVASTLALSVVGVGALSTPEFQGPFALAIVLGWLPAFAFDRWLSAPANEGRPEHSGLLGIAVAEASVVFTAFIALLVNEVTAFLLTLGVSAGLGYIADQSQDERGTRRVSQLAAPPAAWVAVGGACGMVLGALGPWRDFGIGTESGLSSSVDGFGGLVLASGIAALVGVGLYLRRRNRGWLAIGLLGLPFALLFAIVEWVDINDALGLSAVGWGLHLSVVSSIVVGIASIALMARPSEHRPGSASTA